MRPLPAVLGDALAVLVFVGLGRSAHHHVVGLAGMASTSWPFVAGLLAGWLAVGLVRARGGRLGLLGTGLVVWPSTVALGMALRVAAGQGTAPAFVAVALGFLGLFLLGWRCVALAARAGRGAGGRSQGRSLGRSLGRKDPAQAGAGVDTPTPPRVRDP